ncbi:MAG: hypothetical protein JNM88_13185 [Chitinophagaceae bacterium]|nr:hypothetical protein [Chitinophagaceae bacterium]
MDNSLHEMDDKLVQYLDGELAGTEKQSLEQQLAADQTLRQQFDSLLLTREAIRYYGLKEKVAGIHEEIMQEKSERQIAPVRQISSSRRLLRYVAGVAAALILVAGSYMAYTYATLSSQKVYSANYQTYELSTLRDNVTAMTPAAEAYRKGDYASVITIHDTAANVSIADEFLCGAAALESGNDSLATRCFKEVLELNKQSNRPVMNDEAEYYLALTHIHAKQYSEALAMLKKIKADPQHIYHEKISGKLMRQVKMLNW